MNKSEYYDWLLHIIGEEEKISHYSQLLKQLYSMDFFWIHPMDENRARDGKELRRLFTEETHRFLSLRFMEHPCTVLEMMVALAKRIDDDIMYDPDSMSCASQWFWEMVANLGLDQAVDKGYDHFGVRQKVDTMLHREYDRCGNGGLFPIKRRPRKDMRKEEIWNQMVLYLNEITS